YPGISQLHTGGLRAAELATRLLDVCTIGFRGCRELVRVLDPPSVATPELPLILFGVAHGKRQLERGRDSCRKIDVVQKRFALLGIDKCSVEFDFFAPPMSHRRIRGARRRLDRGPLG